MSFFRRRNDHPHGLSALLVAEAVLLAAFAVGQAKAQTGSAGTASGSVGAPSAAGNSGSGATVNNATGSGAMQGAVSGTRGALSTNTEAGRQRQASEEGRLAAASAEARIPDAPTEFQQLVQSTAGRILPIFGASLFENVPTTFAPVEDVPVGPGYILGPGDELRLQLSGQVNQQIDVTVDRTGAIDLPEVGTVHVAGLAYGQLPAYLNSQLSRIYRGFTLSVNLGSLRSIQVFVVGNARRPGSFSISSMSTLTNAIFASGGVLPQGTLRDIQVQRGGKTIAHFDLYDLLLKGDKTKDVTLASGDVIFIPPVGPQAAIVGSVDNPAIYELKGRETVDDLIRMAGGKTSVAAGASVRLERVFEHNMLTIDNVSPQDAGSQPLQPGDIVTVASIVDRFRNAVTLRGNVANPGRYVWHAGMRISDLIPNKESLITRNYWRQRNALGETVTDYLPGNPPVSTQPEGSLQLKSNQADRSSDPAQRNASSGASTGSSVGAALTATNGVFDAKTDVVLSAPDIDWSYAVIERQSSTDLTTSLIPFNLGKIILDGDPNENRELLPGDVVTIFSKADIRVPSAQQTRFVRLEGEFVAAGVYSVLPGETLRGLLRRAGGLTQDAYLYASEFTRESTRRVEAQRLHEYADELQAQISSVTASNQARAVSAADQQAATASQADAEAAVDRLRRTTPIGRIVLDLRPNSQGIDGIPDLALEDGDRFVVPRVPSSVSVQGQVYSPNAFVYASGERAEQYLHRAGGPDRRADKKRSFILRADGSVVSRQYADVERAPIYPGDTLIVPPVLDRRATFQRILDIATIVGNFAVGAAAIDIIARQ